jgi:hypothetical protein
MAEVKVWRNKNGKETPIKDMTVEHIKNCIKMLERSGKTSSKIHACLKTEIEDREKTVPAGKKKFKFIAKD